jgi:AraC-like DNA-binding protein
MGYYCMHFDVDDPLLRRLLVLSGTRLHTADDAVTEALAPGLTRLIGLARRPPEQALVERLETISALFELLAAMGRALATQFDTAPPVPAPILQIANRLAGWIAEQVEAPDTEQPIETLIRRIGYSPAHGNALFARVYGIPPRQYRSRLKLRRAHLLLLDSGLSVQQVADAMGYGEVSHFSRQFKRWSGLSPQAYRQQQARG